MDQQNQNPNQERHIPTPAEIARLEAEAAAALQRGELPTQPKAPTEAGATAAESGAAQPEFVPYVDDVVDVPKPKAASEGEAEIDDDDDEPYIPSVWEKRVDALTPKQWKWTQIIGGAVLGCAAIAILGINSQELSTYRLIVAALLAMLVPRYIERVLRRKLLTARYAMIAAMIVTLVAMFLIIGARNGFVFTKAAE